VRVSSFSDGIYVMRTKEKDRDVLGAKVEAIDGTPIEAAITRVMRLRGGTDGWRRVEAMQILYQQDLLYGTGIAREPGASTWTLRLSSGETVERRFEPYIPSKAEPSKRSTRWLSPEPLKGYDKGWVALRPQADEVPLSLHKMDLGYWRTRLPNSCAAYIHMKAVYDLGEQTIGDFLAETKADLKAHKACAAIVDLRFNTGGDYTNMYSFGSELPSLIDGPVYVLTSPQTFSAAITSTAFIKQAAPAQVHIIGEMVGDRMPFYAEGNGGCLPNYHLCLIYQGGKHDYVHPCNDPGECYWLNFIYRARIATFAPEETIHTSFADWNAGHDPVFDRAVALAARKSKGTASKGAPRRI
jgi:hypothetical protein